MQACFSFELKKASSVKEKYYSLTQRDMRNYEVMLAVRGSLNESEAKSVYESFLKELKKHKAEVGFEESWGKIKIAYKIKHETEAHYFVVQFTTESAPLKELELFMELNTDIIRYISVKINKDDEKFTKAMYDDGMNAYYESREQRKRKAQPKTRSTTAAQLQEDLKKSKTPATPAKSTDEKIEEILEKDLAL
ncbi:30S ribosomal protein S6 [Candidatus Peregrinibacteria bacterium]|nr:30S ribosomal protein S6 [Candidatus Peregrinibacteria bacterium]